MKHAGIVHRAQITATLVAVTLVSFAQGALAGDPCPLSGYSMSYIAHEAHGDLIADNRLARAIERLSNGADPKAFETKTNLCVARTMAGQLSRAGYACKRALEMAAEEMQAADESNRHDAAGRLAIASINLGVLTAMRGDHEGAEIHFRQAMQQGVYNNTAFRNLSHLHFDDPEAIAVR